MIIFIDSCYLQDMQGSLYTATEYVTIVEPFYDRLSNYWLVSLAKANDRIELMTSTASQIVTFLPTKVNKINSIIGILTNYTCEHLLNSTVKLPNSEHTTWIGAPSKPNSILIVDTIWMKHCNFSYTRKFITVEYELTLHSFKVFQWRLHVPS